MLSRRHLLRTMVLASGAIITAPLPSISCPLSTGSMHTANHPTLLEADDCCLWACWLGHSTVLMNIGGSWIITDPVLFDSYGLSILGITFGPRRFSPPALTIEELPRPDLVLLSHAHLDHMDRRSLSAIAERWQGELDVITASNTKDVIEDLPWRSVHEMDWGDRTTVAGVSLTALQVRHNGWRLPGEACRANGQYRSGRSYNGYLLERNGVRVVFGGDTAHTTTFANIRQPVDLAIMPIGAYDPYPETHCTPEESLNMVDMMNARSMMPIHHSTFRQSEEPIADPMIRLRTAIEHSKTKLAVRSIGGSISIQRV
ncbi:MAG TPA: MBL fold metallo-hydrolase [Candidatus Didemnitutus sp.]|nr:MBL fold metallo-hydrolase [Candidatus Didemnitutus sp.]